MKVRLAKQIASLLALAGLLGWGAAVQAQEVPAGTRFAVELRDKLDARKVKRGKEFNARTLEALYASDGSVIPAGAKVRGRVAYADDNELVLDFFRIQTKRGKIPMSASVISVPGERDVKRKVGKEGEIKSTGGRGKGAAIGAAVGAGIGAAVGATAGGGRAAAIGAATGAAGGAIVGAAAGGKDLLLRKGAEIELELNRPLYYGRR